MGSERPIKGSSAPSLLNASSLLLLPCFFLRPSLDRKAMSGEARISLSGTSTAASVFRGAAEAPRGAGARAAEEEEEVVSHRAVDRNLSRLVAITGPTAQAEARERDARRSHLLATLKERTAEVPGLSPL